MPTKTRLTNRNRGSIRPALVALGTLFIGCYRGEFLAGQPCTEDRDCGSVLVCNAGVCGDYPPDVPVLELSLSPIKQFDFEWAPAFGAKYYQLFERVDAGAPYVQIGEDMEELATSLTVPLHFRVNASYKLLACNDHGCSESEVVDMQGSLTEAVGYFKASNTGEFEDRFGWDMALSNDGNTLAIGAPSVIDVPAIGAVYVFVRDGQSEWTQQAHVQASNADEGDHFGISVALSENGDTLAVGAELESSNSIPYAGAVYVFVRDDEAAWTQEAHIEASDPAEGLRFGSSVALSGTGDTLAAGVRGDVEGGVAYLFVRDDQGQWMQKAYLTASNVGYDDDFGISVALSADGSTLAVGAIHEDSNAMGIDGDQDDNTAQDAGAVYVFERDVQTWDWKQEAYVKASNTGAGDNFGYDVALSGDGHTLAVGALRESSSATGIGGEQSDDSAPEAGAVYVFVRNGQSQWTEQEYVKASNTGAGDLFGNSVALSGDGNVLAVAAVVEDSGAIGIDGDQSSNSDDAAGAVYVFVRDAQAQWTQHAYVKATNTDVGDVFGSNVALSGDGSTLAVTATGEDSDATGINGNSADNSSYQAGAVYVY